MIDCRDHLSKAFYHIMKMEMKRNRRLQFPGYHKVNAVLHEMYLRGEAFENNVIYIEDNVLVITNDFFRLNVKERDALMNFMTRIYEESERL